MAIVEMDDENRRRVLAQWMRECKLGFTLTKPDYVAAIVAIDNWIDANQASFNQALPQPFRSGASVEMKAQLFAYVLMRRNGKLHAEEDG